MKILCISIMLITSLCETNIVGKTMDYCVKGFVFHAADYLSKNSPDKALAVFKDPRGIFARAWTYLVVYSPAGIILAHGKNSALNGKNIKHIEDQEEQARWESILTLLKKPIQVGCVHYIVNGSKYCHFIKKVKTAKNVEYIVSAGHAVAAKDDHCYCPHDNIKGQESFRLQDRI